MWHPIIDVFKESEELNYDIKRTFEQIKLF